MIKTTNTVTVAYKEIWYKLGLQQQRKSQLLCCYLEKVFKTNYVPQDKELEKEIPVY